MVFEFLLIARTMTRPSKLLLTSLAIASSYFQAIEDTL